MTVLTSRKIATATFSGASRQKYGFDVYRRGSTLPSLAGVYVVSKRKPKTDGTGVHDFVYVGESSDIADRLSDHHKGACFERHGANAICIRQEVDAASRRKIEADLIAKWAPPCND